MTPAKPSVTLTLGLSIFACLFSNLPPLLQGATAAGGYYGGCPLPAGDASDTLALSPKLNRHLQQEFPLGSPANLLKRELAREGFIAGGACSDDASIQTASYEQQHYVFYETQADIFWKTDRNNRIVWTEGFVFFDGM